MDPETRKQTEVLLQKALEVHRNIPDWLENNLCHTQHDALIAVGVDPSLAHSDLVSQQFRRLVAGSEQANGQPHHPNDPESDTARAVCLRHRIEIVHDSRTRAKATQACVMRMAGFTVKQSGPGADFVRVRRRHDAEVEAAAQGPRPPKPKKAPPKKCRLPKNVLPQQMLPPAARPAATIQVSDDDATQPESGISPLTDADSTSGFFKDNDQEVEHEFFNTPPLFGIAETMPTCNYSLVSDVSTVSSGNVSLKEAVQRPKNINSSMSHLTTSFDSRRTSQAAHIERQTLREMQNVRSSLHKAGTVLCQGVLLKRNTLSIFQSADTVARALNDLTGIDILSGRDLTEAVAKNRVGMSPPKSGRKGELSKEVFDALCNAVFSLCAVEQANCGDGLNREQLKSLVGEVVNEWRESEGKEPMNDSKLYQRIEMNICHLQDLNKADTRESLRVLWLTHQAQLKHCENWEATAVDLGFARRLLPDETPDAEGHIIWNKDLMHRVLQFDEMSVALDGTDPSIGGRESRIPTAKGQKDSGKAAEKSGASMTIMFGLNFGFEALPPLFIFPTKSKDPSNYKLKVDFAATVPQLKGQCGFDAPRFHNIPFAMNPKGGMNKEMLIDYFEGVVLPLYPDAIDREDKRLLLKIDSGPGRSNPECLVKLRARGAYPHPGLPNGTECGQECDQLFAFLKKLIYSNREKLWAARFRIEGASASLSMADVALLVYGGKATMVDGSEVELTNAFEQAMDNEHIASAAKKCGYAPSTRVALNASQIRHEIVESIDGEIDSNADPHGALLDELEKQNKEACEELEALGFGAAKSLLRKVKRVTAAQTFGRNSTLTVPNARERQDALMGCATAGAHFHVTNGGGPMNSDDCLIANARKAMIARAEELEKKKRSCSKTDTRSTAAANTLKDAKDCSKWNKKELQTMIKWKQGASPEAPFNDNVNQNKPVLLKLWEDKCANRVAAESDEWNSDMEEELDRCLSGEIIHFAKDVGLERCMETEDDGIIIRLNTIGRSRARKILLNVLKGMSKEDADSIIAEFYGDF